MTTATRLEAFLSQRNSNFQSDAILKGLLGLGFSLFTFGGFWWIAWLLFGTFKAGWLSPIPLALTTLYGGVATWSAWRGVDPLRSLAPLSAADADRRAIAAAVSEFAGVGGLEGAGTREGVAGCANWLIAGPQSVLEAIAAWRKRVWLPEPLLSESAAFLESLPAEAGGERAALALLVLGLAQVELDPQSGAPLLTTTRKGRSVLGQAPGG